MPDIDQEGGMGQRKKEGQNGGSMTRESCLKRIEALRQRHIDKAWRYVHNGHDPGVRRQLAKIARYDKAAIRLSKGTFKYVSTA